MFIESDWRQVTYIASSMVEEQGEDLGSFSSFHDDNDETVESNSSFSSSSSDFIDDATSPSSHGNFEEEEGPHFEMSDLFAQLPFKNGLSKHFQGKSQSFSSLSDVKVLEDLAKSERPCKNKLKCSKSYGRILLDSNKNLSCAKSIAKKPIRVSFSSLGPKRKGFFGSSRLPFSSLRPSGDISGQALLFA